MTTTFTMILTGCIVHNSFKVITTRQNITTTSMILTGCIFHDGIQSDSIKKP